ncbi:hypothetical protein CDAR_42811 [Caerostris darwini]|uniref:Uncharacterized protein n=1 Tax=Caerostris darwini TaxID=1538125 RepID=A0AAV4WHG6_9ARAC|nr:hypothetical protein CDAR_42811 [Caerostris darwini]
MCLRVRKNPSSFAIVFPVGIHSLMRCLLKRPGGTDIACGANECDSAEEVADEITTGTYHLRIDAALLPDIFLIFYYAGIGSRMASLVGFVSPSPSVKIILVLVKGLGMVSVRLYRIVIYFLNYFKAK